MAKGKGKEPTTFAYEEFMARARKEGRVRNETLSMKVLKPDLSLQARVEHLNVDHVRALHDIHKGGQQLAPIIVFEIEQLKGKAVVKAYKIADGFHRYEVYRREGSPGIPCIVVTGTLQEAIEYAASANQSLSLKRTREDIKKALWLLLENGWLDKAGSLLAKHIGLAYQTVNRYRSEYCDMIGVTTPETITRKDGSLQRPPRKSNEDCRLAGYTDRRGITRFRTSVNGRHLYLGTNKAEAERKLVEVNDQRKAGAIGTLATFAGLRQACESHGVKILSVSSEEDAALRFVHGFRRHSVAVSVWEDGSHADLIRAVGSVFLIAAHWQLPRKIVVKKLIDHAFAGAVAAAAKAGIEFMTLDEFVAAMKADDDGAAGAMAIA